MNKIGIIGHVMLTLHVTKWSTLESKKASSNIEKKYIWILNTIIDRKCLIRGLRIFFSAQCVQLDCSSGVEVCYFCFLRALFYSLPPFISRLWWANYENAEHSVLILESSWLLSIMGTGEILPVLFYWPSLWVHS